MLFPVFHMGEEFEMFSLLNHYLHFPFPSCATPGCYCPAANFEFYSIFAQCSLFPNLLVLVFDFFVCKELERVYPSLICVEYVYRKHPQPILRAKHQCITLEPSALLKCCEILHPFFVTKSFYSWLCN